MSLYYHLQSIIQVILMNNRESGLYNSGDYMKKKSAGKIVAVFVLCAFALIMMANMVGMFAMDSAMADDDEDSIEVADGDENNQVVDHRIDEPCDEEPGVQVVDYRIDTPSDSSIGNYVVEHRIDCPF